MRRCATVAFLAVLVLSAKVGAVEFGFDLGTRAVGLWAGDYNFAFPQTGRAGVMDLLVNIPLSSATSVNFKVGGYESTNHGTEGGGTRSVVDLNGIDGRVAFFFTVPIVKDAVSAYAGVGATYCYFRYSSVFGDMVLRVTENGMTVGVPAGLKLRLSQRLTACAEMEVPDVGFYHDAASEGTGWWPLAWWQYGSVEPSVTAGLYLRY
jgi:hypothetical protein